MHLMSQVKYKLSDYQASMKNYICILKQDKDAGNEANQISSSAGEENLEGDEIMDIITNYLACESSIGQSSIEEI